MHLYHRLPINIYYRMRFWKDYLFPKKEAFAPAANPRFWFLDAPSYGNVGDQAIAYALVRFLRTHFSAWDIIEISEDNIIGQLAHLKHHIQPQDIIVLNGGGNIGNLYPRYEFIRRQIIRSFPHNPIVVFPSSIYFTDTWQGKSEAKISAQIYGKHPRLVICARDSQSFRTMKTLFAQNTILLCPDIVFSLQNVFSFPSKQDKVGVCLRNDNEKTLTNQNKEKLFVFLKKHFSKIEILSTTSLQNNILVSEKEDLVVNKLKEFAVCQLIVTDRLHGLIFAYITHTPCLIIPSRTGKVISLYNDWLSKKNFVSICSFEKRINLPEMCPNSASNTCLDFSVLQSALEALISKDSHL